MLEEIVNSIDSEILMDNIEEALKYELAIRNKKNQGKKLTEEEKFFDTYTIKPSRLIEIIIRLGDKYE